jgi:MFS family permease
MKLLNRDSFIFLACIAVIKVASDINSLQLLGATGVGAVACVYFFWMRSHTIQEKSLFTPLAILSRIFASLALGWLFGCVMSAVVLVFSDKREGYAILFGNGVSLLIVVMPLLAASFLCHILNKSQRSG